MARRKKETVEVTAREPGDDEDPFADPPAAAVKSDFIPPAKATPLDDFIAEGRSNGKVPAIPAALAGVVEHAFAVDVEKEYLRLLGSLELGSKRTDRAAIREALDRVDFDTVTAARIYRAAKAIEESHELDTRERIAALRDEARRNLEAEKEAGARKKQITEGDIEDFCVANFGDEWRAIAQNRSKIHGTVRALEELVLSYRSRQASVRQLAAASE